ncbi:DUF3987 domain-containing protein, partial [Candidatus Nomurabacteria bacterium]|nr:DUF3987 domain-containing protein [Candidatus Nomurabacteria bacterium]
MIERERQAVDKHKVDPLNIFPEGFIRNYFNYAEPLTDAPSQFHIPTALIALSTAIGNNVYLPLGDKKLFPNIWALIIAPSSTHRKSSALQIGLNLIRQLDKKLVYPSEFSQEAFFELLSTQPQGVLAYSEFSVLLEMSQRSYLVGIKETLTDLYDCRPWISKKLKAQEYTIVDGCLSLIGASTVDWLIGQMKEGDIRGGFLARFLYFPASKKTKSLPIPPKADPAKREALVRELEGIREAFKGEMEISPEARACYEEWYLGSEKALDGEIRSDLLSSFFNRLPDYCWKIAMLYTVSVEKKLTISGVAVSRAIALTEYLKSSIKQLVEEKF